MSRGDELRDGTRLTIEGINAVTTLVEDMHRTIGSGPAVLGKPLALPARLITKIIYGSIRGVTSAVGSGLDGALERLAPALGQSVSRAERDAVLAVLNGVIGDYLEQSGNALAIQMSLRYQAESLNLGDARSIATAIPEPTGKILLMVHGSVMNDRQWLRNEHDHGVCLARDLGYTPVHVLYNTGRHISKNGEELAEKLEHLVAGWPVPAQELVVVGHSMGGLVARSACRAAESGTSAWRRLLRAMVFLGSPHHGAPLEQTGAWIDALLGVSRYSAPFKRLARIRSAGVTDLRFGYLVEEHWQGRERFDLTRDERTPVPLPRGVQCFAVAASLGEGPGGRTRGDGLVSVPSALGRHDRAELCLNFPDPHTLEVSGLGHLDLLSDSRVYAAIRDWLA